MFLGRKKELAELERRYISNKKEFGIVWGRRRIGKTSLINEFCQNKNALMFQAKQDNAFGNLRSFSYELNKLLKLPKNYVFSSWEEAFDSIIDFAEKKGFCLSSTNTHILSHKIQAFHLFCRISLIKLEKIFF